MKEWMQQNPYILITLLGSVLIVLMVIRCLIRLRSKYSENPKYNKLEVHKNQLIGKREFQEDAMNVVALKKGVLAVLADGRGKKQAGRLSSQIAINIFTQIFIDDVSSMMNPNYFFKKAFHLVNREILKNIGDEKGGASIASVMITNGKMYYALVGNALVAVYRNQELIPLSEGHTVSVLAKRGYYQGKITRQEAIWALQEKRIFNYVGQDGFRDVEIYDMPINLKKNDVIILMSDGVKESISWHELEEIIKVSRTCKEITKRVIGSISKKQLVDQDNASLICMRYTRN